MIAKKEYDQQVTEWKKMSGEVGGGIKIQLSNYWNWLKKECNLRNWTIQICDCIDLDSSSCWTFLNINNSAKIYYKIYFI